MGLANWLFGKEVNKMVNNRLNNFKYEVPGREIYLPKLASYRQQEYNVWASGNPVDLLKFYSTYRTIPGEWNENSRQLFWEWVGGINSVPKLHFPTPEIIINQMKSLIFSDDLDIYVNTENETLDVELTEQLKLILDENDSNEKYQTGIFYETYSGSVAYRFVYRPDVSEYPIIIPYPAERVRLRTTLGKIQEIIFLDEYAVGDKKYTLKSYYGKGYINHRLYNEKDIQVPIDTVEELKEGYGDYIFAKDGKPIPILMATFKKNRSSSNEFIGTEFGGSDFEGLTDTFNLIDELYSQKNLYVRRARPFMQVSEKQLKMDDKTGREILPKEYELDTIVTRGADVGEKENQGFKRDLPELNVTPYDASIKEELKNVFMKIGLAYTTVGLEGIGANASGASLEIREKTTVIVRQNKIKLWDRFLKDTYRLLLIYNSLKDLTKGDVSNNDGVTTYNIKDTFDYKYTIEFPVYNNQTFLEKVEEASKALGVVFDYKSAIDHALKDLYTQEEKDAIVRNVKIENGVPLIGDELIE